MKSLTKSPQHASERLAALAASLGTKLGVDDAAAELSRLIGPDALTGAELSKASKLNRAQRHAAAAIEQRASAPPPLEKLPERYRNKHIEAVRRRHDKDRQFKRALHKRIADAGIDPTKQDRVGWSMSTWWFFTEAKHDPTSRTILRELDIIQKRAPAFAGAVVRAALDLVPGGARRTWTSERARSIAMLAIAMWKDSISTHRRDSFRRLFRGITIGSMCAALARPAAPGRKPTPLHRNTLCGRRFVGASVEAGGLGYLLQLEDCGAWYTQRLPPHCVEPRERWIVPVKNKATGKVEDLEVTSNRYCMRTAHPNDAHLDDDARALAAELAAHAEALDTIEPVIRRGTAAEVEARFWLDIIERARGSDRIV